MVESGITRDMFNVSCDKTY